MRIAAKKLRYTMEIYKKAFDKRLDESIKVIRRIQSLLGDIHDCDVWCEFIRIFTQAERQRTVEYYGHARCFHRLRPGFEYLGNERLIHRREKFDELVALWKDLQDGGFWDELAAFLKAPHMGSCSRAFNDALTRTGRPASEMADASTSLNSEESNLVHASSSQVESLGKLGKREKRASSPVPKPDQEEPQTYTSADEEPEEEIDAETPSADAELIRVFETSDQGKPPLPDHTAAHPSAPDRPAVSTAPSTENVICECCGLNSFAQDELLRIDSGQRLCPGCLDELHEKAGRSTHQ